MADISQWTNSAGSQPHYSEGMAPSAVNDDGRQVMAAVRRWYDDAEWINPGYTPSYSTATSFTLVGNRVSLFHAGRRLKLNDGANTYYGHVTSNTYSANTLVNVSLSVSGSLTTSLSGVSIGLISFNNDSIPRGKNNVIYASDYPLFSNALIAAAGKELVIDASVTLDVTATITSTISLRPSNPGVINANGKTLTINAPVVGNPMHQWLSGFTGYDVRFGKLVDTVHGEWFGMVGDASTDNSSPLLVWLKCLSQENAVSPEHRKKKGRLGSGQFNFSTAITEFDGTVHAAQMLTIEGAIPDHLGRTGSGSPTIIHYTGSSGYGFTIGTQSANDATWDSMSAILGWDIKNIRFTGTANADGGIKCAVAELAFESVSFTGFTKTGAVALNMASISSVLDKVHFYNCNRAISHIGNINTMKSLQIHTCVNGILDRFSNQLTIKDSLFQTITNFAIDATNSALWAGGVAGGMTIKENYFEDCQHTPGDAVIRVTGPNGTYPYDGITIRNNGFYAPGSTGANHIRIGAYVSGIDTHHNYWFDGGILTVPRLSISADLAIYDASTADFVQAYTTATTLTSDQHGRIITNTGATTSVTLTLPRPAKGFKLKIYKTANYDLILQCDSQSTIQDSNVQKKYKNVTANEEFKASVTLRGLGQVGTYWRWTVEAEKGTWVVDNT